MKPPRVDFTTEADGSMRICVETEWPQTAAEGVAVLLQRGRAAEARWAALREWLEAGRQKIAGSGSGRWGSGAALAKMDELEREEGGR